MSNRPPSDWSHGSFPGASFRRSGRGVKIGRETGLLRKAIGNSDTPAAAVANPRANVIKMKAVGGLGRYQKATPRAPGIAGEPDAMVLNINTVGRVYSRSEYFTGQGISPRREGLAAFFDPNKVAVGLVSQFGNCVVAGDAP